MDEGKDGQESTRIGVHSFRQFLLEYILMAELKEIHRQRLSGVYVVPSASSPLVWYGLLFIRSGDYRGGVFKFTLNLPPSYPDGGVVPSVTFQPPVFHPMVDMVTGELSTRHVFAKWRRQVNSLAELLAYVKLVFYKIESENAANPEAALLFSRERDAFQKRARESVDFCLQRLRRDGASQHSELAGSQLQDALSALLRPSDDTTQDTADSPGTRPTSPPVFHGQGLSWVKPGTSHSFSLTYTSQ